MSFNVLTMSSKIRSFVKLLRVRQYYKNVMIFVGVFFSERLFEVSLYFNLLIGFILLCCTSSFNYIINDLKDIEKDRKHAEKIKNKPLASGDLSSFFAILTLTILSIMLNHLNGKKKIGTMFLMKFVIHTIS